MLDRVSRGRGAWLGLGPWEEGSERWGLGTGLIRTLAKEKGWHDGQQGFMAAGAEAERREQLGVGGGRGSEDYGGVQLRCGSRKRDLGQAKYGKGWRAAGATVNRGGNRCSRDDRPHPSVSAAGTLNKMDGNGETQCAWPQAAPLSTAAPAAEGSGRGSERR